ncbi:MAG: LysR family transcriptional regulator [Polyangiaceae bacterium]
MVRVAVSDAFTLDQLRTWVAVTEQGSFSAAARKLSRVQSAVSTAMANLEQALGVPVWDRSAKLPVLTAQGRALLVAARRVCAEVDGLRQQAQELAGGVEPAVSLCVDQLFPEAALVQLCRDFARTFPAVDLRVDMQLMSAVTARVLAGTSTVGVVTPLGMAPGLERRALGPVRMVAVVAPSHPLAQTSGKLSTARLAEFVQVVLSERDDHGVPDQAVLSPRTWRVADLHTKHAMLRAGLGWGNLPEHLVDADLRRGTLCAIRPAAWGDDEHILHLSAVYRSTTLVGPAHRWMLDRLEELCAENVSANAARGRARRGGPRHGGRRAS